MEFLLCVLLGYFVGAFNPSYIIGKLRGLDIRQKGSGNAGASNALILWGKLTGAFCALLDIFKTFFVIRLTRRLFPAYSLAFAVTAACCILGHIFPFYMRFRGGKGLACLGGMILAYDWRVFLVMLGAEFVIAFMFNYLCLVPITAAFAFPIVYGILSGELLGAALLLVPAVVILFRHMENLRRIRNGTELHMSYLWKPEAEITRISQNMDADAEAVFDHFSPN